MQTFWAFSKHRNRFALETRAAFSKSSWFMQCHVAVVCGYIKMDISTWKNLEVFKKRKTKHQSNVSAAEQLQTDCNRAKATVIGKNLMCWT